MELKQIEEVLFKSWTHVHMPKMPHKCQKQGGAGYGGWGSRPLLDNVQKKDNFCNALLVFKLFLGRQRLSIPSHYYIIPLSLLHDLFNDLPLSWFVVEASRTQIFIRPQTIFLNFYSASCTVFLTFVTNMQYLVFFLNKKIQNFYFL